MKIFEFVPCVGYPMPSKEEEDQKQPSRSSLSERRRGGRKAESTWRPSLGAISEDGAVSTTTVTAKKVAEKSSKGMKKTPAASKKKQYIGAPDDDWEQIHRDDLRHFAVPAFTPTAFLF